MTTAAEQDAVDAVGRPLGRVEEDQRRDEDRRRASPGRRAAASRAAARPRSRGWSTAPTRTRDARRERREHRGDDERDDEGVDRVALGHRADSLDANAAGGRPRRAPAVRAHAAHTAAVAAPPRCA